MKNSKTYVPKFVDGHFFFFVSQKIEQDVVDIGWLRQAHQLLLTAIDIVTIR